MRRPIDLDAPLSQDELALLKLHLPDAVATTTDGELVGLRTRREVYYLQLRYPSMNPMNVAPTTRTGSADADTLAARYPTMARSSR
jgi:hypothetical protein